MTDTKCNKSSNKCPRRMSTSPFIQMSLTQFCQKSLSIRTTRPFACLQTFHLFFAFILEQNNLSCSKILLSSNQFFCSNKKKNSYLKDKKSAVKNINKCKWKNHFSFVIIIYSLL